MSFNLQFNDNIEVISLFRKCSLWNDICDYFSVNDLRIIAINIFKKIKLRNLFYENRNSTINDRN